MGRIFVFGFLFHGIRILTGAFIVIYMLQKGLSILDIGWIKAFQAIIMLVIDVPLGYWSDKKSHKNAVVFAAGAAMVWLFLMGRATNFWLFLLAEFFNALSLVLISGAYNALLIHAAKQKGIVTAKILGASYKWNHIGMFVFSLLGAWFSDYFVVNIWYLAAALMFMTVIYGWLALANPVIEKNYSTTQNSLINIWHDLRQMKSLSQQFWLISLLFIGIGVIFNVIAQYWQLLFPQSNIEIRHFELGLAFSFLLLSQSGASLLFEKITEKMAIILVCLLPIFLSIPLIFNVLTEKYMVFLVIIVLFFVVRLIYLFVETRLHDAIADHLRATYESFLSTIMRAVLLVAFPLSAYLIEMHGFAYLGYGLIFMGIGLLGYGLRETVKKPLLS